MSRCFGNNRRLKKPSEYSAVYNSNQSRAQGQYFTVLAFSRFSAVAKPGTSDTIREPLPPSRLGAVVSKKVAKAAVRRNRIKRLIRESFRIKLHPHGVDFVVIAKPAAAAADNVRLAKELNYLWKKIHHRCATA